MKPEWRPDDWDKTLDALKDKDYDDYYCEWKRYDTGIELGASAMLAALLKWLFERCDKHNIPLPKGTVGITDPGWRTYKHRKDCPQCMAELQEKTNG